jgi:hypothetical protein
VKNGEKEEVLAMLKFDLQYPVVSFSAFFTGRRCLKGG